MLKDAYRWLISPSGFQSIVFVSIVCDCVGEVAYLMQQECHTVQYWQSEIMPMVQSDTPYHLPESATIRVNGSMRVHLTNNPMLYRPFEEYVCKVGFVVTHADYRMMLTWTNFEVGENRGGNDWFHVLDRQSDFDLSGAKWGSLQHLSDYHSIGDGLTLAYRGHPYFDTLTILLTEIKDIQPNGVCERNLSLCNGDFRVCIPRWLHCNRENNCGEGDSDERNCQEEEKAEVSPPSTSSSSVGLIGALLGIFVTMLLVTLIGIVVYICKRKMLHQRGWHAHTCHGSHPRDIHALSQSQKIPAENLYTPMPMAQNGAVHQVNLGDSHQPLIGNAHINPQAVSNGSAQPVPHDIEDEYMELPSVDSTATSLQDVNHIYAEPEVVGSLVPSNTPILRPLRLQNNAAVSALNSPHPHQPHHAAAPEDDHLVLLDLNEPLSNRVVGSNASINE